MTFPSENYLLANLGKLVGTRLTSLRGHRELRIIAIDAMRGRIRLQIGERATSRSLRELVELWHILTMRHVVHVDSALRGSGSSRNQPETILAAMPCVEWTSITGRKHLVYREAETHPLGAPKQLDPLLRERLLAKLNDLSVPIVAVLIGKSIFTERSANTLAGLGQTKVIQPGVALLECGTHRILGIAPDLTSNVPEGAYLLSRGFEQQACLGQAFEIFGLQLQQTVHPHVLSVRGELWNA